MKLRGSMNGRQRLVLGIATAVAEVAYRDGLATHPKPDDLRQHIKEFMFVPEYRPLV